MLGEEVLTQSKEVWEPSQKEYDPQISVEQWKLLLGNKKVFTKNALLAMSRMIALGGKATCTQLAVKFGGTYRFYNSVFTSLAKRVTTETLCPMPPKRANGTYRYLAVLYVMRKVKENDGVWEFKLRESLKTALIEAGFPFKEDTNITED